MDIREIFELMERFESSQIAELEVDHTGTKLKMKKDQSAALGTTIQVQPKEVSVERTVNMAEKTTEPKQAAQHKVTEVKAPLVGTFYRAPAPDQKPFVLVGQSVKKGEVIGIIEAMKLMNEIVAPEDGVIESIQVEDETMVEFDQVIFTLSKGE